MPRLLLHPLRLDPGGTLAKAEHGSDAHIGSAVSVHLGTRIGERVMCWPFGVRDPTFAGLHPADLQASLSRFGPDGIRITAVDTVLVTDTAVTARVSWERT